VDDDAALREDVMSGLLAFISSVVLHNVEVAQQIGLGGSDAQFVGLLQVHGPLTAGRLAELSGLSTGTVTGVLDRLERAGFVRRERDATDRRKVLVVPSKEGQQRLQEAYAGHGAFAARVLSTRTPDELRVIASFLAELNASPG
jgi:DNA-binding MarR family transcriptional regulator